MQGICKFVQSADQFGARSQISFFDSDGKFRTIYGGILSLMIYAIGSSYFIYLIYIWQTFQIPPTITVQSQFDDAGSSFNLKRPPYVFSLELEYGNEETFQLQKKGDVFQYEIQGYNVENLTKNCSYPKYTPDYYDPICMNLEDEAQTNLFQNYTNRSQDTYVSFSIDQCDPNFNHRCLSFDDQSKIFNSFALWRLTLLTQEIDLKSGNITEIPQDYYFPAIQYPNMSAYFFSLRVRKGTYKIDTGILFPNIRTIEIVKSIQLLNYVTQLNNPINNLPLIANIEYHLDRTEEIITVTHPKLGQILADLGSILQVLLMFGMVVNFFNHTRMQLRIEQILLGIYFPEIKLFEFKYNWRGKLQSISQMGQILRDFDFERMKLFKETTGNQLRSKLNYLNILHEISRLQIQIQLKIPRSELIQYQSLGYTLKLPQFGNNQTPVNDDGLILDQKDFQILCHQKHDQHDEQNKPITDEDKLLFSDSSGQNLSPRDLQKLNNSRRLLMKPQEQVVKYFQSLRLIPKVQAKISSPEPPELIFQNQIVKEKIQEQDFDQQLLQINNEIHDEEFFSNRLIPRQIKKVEAPLPVFIPSNNLS